MTRSAPRALRRMMGTRTSAVVVDLALAAAAFIDVAVSIPSWSTIETAFALVAVAGLLVRRRLPWVSFALVLPGLVVDSMTIAAPIALYSVAVRTRGIPPLVVAGAVTFACFLLPDWQLPSLDFLAPSLLYALMYAATPIALGALVRTHRELSDRVADLSAARETEREREKQDVLRRERARISREMHDVVSHQVSLVAVQAGALQVSSPDPESRRVAHVIRSLAVRTLDELRQMVGVLRAEGARTDSDRPQPTLDDLPRLVEESGLDTDLDVSLPVDLAPPLQRAVYRTVQEGLTNARKHAPGARVRVTAVATTAAIDVVVQNDPPSQEGLRLPSSGTGLAGLRERAELLGGHLDAAARDGGGYRLRVTIPRRDSEH
ncbi:signal transduction histidine kinase, glucose-6-phosphate specific [Microbacterium testaceum StLB037]|uniref:histidine kinase n=1 Tax=Microbacterium testaceum (strain StLB037) TaxID=979556 RepID=E8NED8_MICTS|nr:histidine kinase [Microbacterium testaceum]BAJ73804.1 signal transduction histidine kinase, glucose-6-phosphate specific [Microbacterium testaceum StLB037]